MNKYNVIVYDFNSNQFKSYDVLEYFIDEYNKIKKSKRPKTFDDIKNFIKGKSLYQFWSRCQYEIILSDWPNNSFNKKIDVHYQIMMNIDIVTKLFMENIKEYKKIQNEQRKTISISVKT